MAKAKSADGQKPTIADTIHTRGENYYPLIMYRESGLILTVYNETEEQIALDEGWKWHVKELHGEDVP